MDAIIELANWIPIQSCLPIFNFLKHMGQISLHHCYRLHGTYLISWFFGHDGVQTKTATQKHDYSIGAIDSSMEMIKRPLDIFNKFDLFADILSDELDVSPCGP